MVQKVLRRELASPESTDAPPAEASAEAFENAIHTVSPPERQPATGEGTGGGPKQNPYASRPSGREITAKEIDEAKPEVVLTVILGAYQQVEPSCAPPSDTVQAPPVSARNPDPPVRDAAPASSDGLDCVDAWDPATWDISHDDPNECYLSFGEIKVWLAPVFAEMNLSQPGSPAPPLSPSQIAEQRRQQRGNGQQVSAPVTTAPQTAPSAPVIRA